MKQPFLKILLVGLSLSCLCVAEEFKIPDLEKLAQKAKETVDVTLDQSMLQLASGFLSKDDPDEAKVKKLVAKLKGIYVRSFEFAREGEYSAADVQAFRNQLKQPGWSRIVGVKSVEGENTEVYVLKNGDQFGGLVVLATEPKEFTIVHIDGPINPEDLAELSGHMGIPELTKPKSKADKKEE
jgi:5-methylcytosine-specific restriction endonuclease McrBC GTP-binding regulatory subunit McrB